MNLNKFLGAALNSAGTGWWGELRKNGVTNDVINSFNSNGAVVSGGVIGHWSMVEFLNSFILYFL